MRSINLIGQEWSSDPIDLHFIFQWIHEGQEHSWQSFFVILCNASMKRNGVGNYLHFTVTQIFSVGKQTTLTVFMPISCLIQSCRYFFFFHVVTSTYPSHILNAQNVINWKRNFKENKIRKYLWERITKEVVIIRIESCSSIFMQIRCNFPDISYISKTQKNNFQFLNEFNFWNVHRKPVFKTDNQYCKQEASFASCKSGVAGCQSQHQCHLWRMNLML